MHVRFSTCRGLPIIEKGTDEVVGYLSGLLIDPDKGKIAGFYVDVRGVLSGTEAFCSAIDILKWGMTVTISSRDVLGPVEDCFRLQSLLADERTVLGQRVRTVSGVQRGVCRDVQFDTDKMMLTWLFPKKWWRWGTAVPVGEVVEVTKDSIIVRDPPVMEKESVSAGEALERLQDIAESIARPS